MNCCWILNRSSAARPAWYAAAWTFAVCCSHRAVSLACCLLEKYTTPGRFNVVTNCCSRSCFSASSATYSTSKNILGRSTDSVTTCGVHRSCLAISCRVCCPAVAVKTSVNGCPSRSRMAPNSRYSGRKSGPHCTIQWASSITNKLSVNCCTRASIVGWANISGDKNKNWIWSSWRKICWRSVKLVCEVIAATRLNPLIRIRSTWSFINDNKGDTTNTHPGWRYP